MKKILKPIMVLAFVVLTLPSLTFAQYVRNGFGFESVRSRAKTDAHLINAWGLVQLATQSVPGE